MTDKKLLFVSDVHFPSHDPRMVNLWIKVLKWLKPDSVDLLGDIDDADSTSRWAEGTPREWVNLEDGGVKLTREFLAQINSIVPDAEKHFFDGNHGWFRHGKYLEKNAPQIMEYVTPDLLYQYKASNFEWHTYDEPPLRRHGDLYCHHGESISKHSGESVRNDVLSYGVSLIRGHSHRQGEYAVTYPLSGQILRGYEIGHLMDPTKQIYDRTPNWQPGFAWGLEHDGAVHINTIPIIDYSCNIGLKTFTA